MEYFYVSRDLYLVSFLILNGFQLARTTSKDEVVFFHFKSSEKLKELVLDYFSRNTIVEPTRFLYEIKNLRHLVKDTLRQQALRQKDE